MLNKEPDRLNMSRSSKQLHSLHTHSDIQTQLSTSSLETMTVIFL